MRAAIKRGLCLTFACVLCTAALASCGEVRPNDTRIVAEDFAVWEKNKPAYTALEAGGDAVLGEGDEISGLNTARGLSVGDALKKAQQAYGTIEYVLIRWEENGEIKRENYPTLNQFCAQNPDNQSFAFIFIRHELDETLYSVQEVAKFAQEGREIEDFWPEYWFECVIEDGRVAEIWMSVYE